jgi:hypothetical protein
MKTQNQLNKICLITVAILISAGALAEASLAIYSTRHYRSQSGPALPLEHLIDLTAAVPGNQSARPESAPLTVSTSAPVTTGFVSGKPTPKPYTPAPSPAFVYPSNLSYWGEGLNSHSCADGGWNKLHMTANLQSTKTTTVTYQWFRSDGQTGPTATITLNGTETKSVDDIWTMTGETFNGNVYIRILSGAQALTSPPRALYYDLYC